METENNSYYWFMNGGWKVYNTRIPILEDMILTYKVGSRNKFIENIY